MGGDDSAQQPRDQLSNTIAKTSLNWSEILRGYVQIRDGLASCPFVTVSEYILML